MASFTQKNRLIAIETSLGPDKLLLQSFTGREGISRLFDFDLELLSDDPALSFTKLVGQPATVSVVQGDGSQRHFNGIISRFAQVSEEDGLTQYQAEMVPWLWFLTRTADCRIFQNMKVPDIIEKIFKDLGFSEYQLKLQGSYQPRTFCVQYRETDFNFVSRLMEQYGIFYYFEHEKGKHTLVLADSPKAHQACPGHSSVRFAPQVERASEAEDVINSLNMEQEFRPGKYAMTDYNFETPSTSLMSTVPSNVTVGGNGKYEVYDYPGEYLKKADGDDLVKIRMEEEEATHLTITGSGSCRGFTSGFRFDLKEHGRSDLNQAYVLVDVQHQASVGDNYTTGGGGDDGGYSNSFTCIPHKVPFRPQRETPKPVVQGPQTAVVVGPGGEEIFVDKYGRVKVQFHWDREGQRDENSSCWVRVSQNWAGKKWGAMFIPRIGQEVIVEFLEGDPDQPIITGRVYNAEQMPPYALPANQTQSGIKSRSTKGGDPETFNEIRFEDKKGSEEMYLHAEKDQNTVVENDQGIEVGHDRNKEVKNNQSETVGVNKKISVGGNHSETIGGNETVTVGIAAAHTIAAAKALTIGAGYQVTVGAAMNESIGAVKAEEIGGAKYVNVGGESSESIGKSKTVEAGEDISESADKDVGILSGKKMSLTAGDDFSISGEKKGEITIEDELTITVGKASIVLKKNGDIIIGGKKISAKASGDIVMKGSKILKN